jgi:Xaa-Pro aminopeptidase
MRFNADRAREVLQAADLGGIISATLENNFYLSGIWFHGQELFPRDGESYVVAGVDHPERGTVVTSIGGADEALEARDTIVGIETFGTFFREIIPGVELDDDERRVAEVTAAHETGRSSLDALAAAIEGQGLVGERIAVDERGAAAGLLDKLAERLPSTTFVPGYALFRKIRSVKTQDEVDSLVATLRVTENALRETFEAMTEGVTERELKLVFERSILTQGARPSFCLVRFSRGMALGQIPAGDTQLAPGDFVFFDLGCNLDGYKSDIGRVVSFGEPTESLRQQFDAVRAGQQTAIDTMRPGIAACDVFHAAVGAVRAAGLPDYKRHHVGHAIGLETYDMPVITPNDSTDLAANMVFEVETPLYQIGVGGAFIEDTVHVTDDGARILTEIPRELIVVEPT